MLETAAGKYGLSTAFFTRLIRQESDFDPKAISRAGAMGIAQFMPGTARWRGLADPFEPKQALEESARWLTELRAAFGRLDWPLPHTMPVLNASKTGLRGAQISLAKHSLMFGSNRPSGE